MRLPAVCGLILTVACARPVPAPPPPDSLDPALADGWRYVHDATYRRQQLEASLVNPANGYSQLRLAQYDDSHWGALPEWNPSSRTATAADVGLRPSAAGLAALDVDGTAWEQPALIDLGRRAFFTYPAQLEPALLQVVATADGADRYGFWKDSAGAIGSLVWTQGATTQMWPSFTCASCHASPGPDGTIVAGLPNARMNEGRLLNDRGSADPNVARWGPGRIDVTNDDQDNPTAIPDLRPVRSQVNLHHAASVRNGLIPLALRVETLIITSLGQSVRPPRKLALAIALFLWDLQPRAVEAPSETSARGEALFKNNCATCHIPPDYSGPAIALSVVGTNPAVGLSPDRTTGKYRVPSLRGVGDRSPLLADGAVTNIDELFNSRRTAPGHQFGLALSDSDRADLITFLRTLE